MLESIVTEIRWKINEHKNRTGDPCIYLVPPTEILVPGITPYCLGETESIADGKHAQSKQSYVPIRPYSLSKGTWSHADELMDSLSEDNVNSVLDFSFSSVFKVVCVINQKKKGCRYL